MDIRRSLLPPLALSSSLLAASCAQPAPAPSAPPPPTAAAADAGTAPDAGAAHADGSHGGPPAHVDTPMARDDERHLKNIQQLSFGGENAEAYFDQTGKQLILQSKRDGAGCDAIYRMTAEGKDVRKVSVGDGRTTCSFIRPDGKILYSSTHGHGAGCLDEPDRSKGYVWKVYPEMDIWVADDNGNNAKVLFQSPGYDAEATVCHKDGRVVFTSSKDGDLDIYMADKDMKKIVRLTSTPGYDGGAFWSEDCSKIVWRASRPEGEELADYQALLKENLVRPTKLEIYVADVKKDWQKQGDGKALDHVVQVTKNGKANFAPYLHPDNKRVLYVSNQADPKGRDFDIFLVNVDGTGEERVTMNPTFDGFPMFSPDGKKLVFASNRANKITGETNVFIADWVD